MSGEATIRGLPDAAARTLGAGAAHYTAFVGPPDQYDLIGATQFTLLITLGLRDHHRLLDFGCGSLRAGRLLIAYLQRGNYHGLEPNAWLVEDAIERQVGRDQVAIKQPRFHAYDDFHLLMPLWICRRWDGQVVAREHTALKWVRPNKLRDYPMPPADIPLIAHLIDLLM